MINIFYVPGMFGSTIEFILRSYTNEYTPVDVAIDNDGAMHAYNKEHHLLIKNDILSNLTNLSVNSITTPIYPFKQDHLPEILEAYQIANIYGNNILVYADSIRSAELNMLFQYHKIANGQTVKLGLEIFAGNNGHNLIDWNPKYKHWSEMEVWEFREWFSLFYTGWVKEWIYSSSQVPDTFLKIKNTEVLFNTKDTFLKIINFCKLTQSRELDTFITEWINKQQYILNEFNLLDQIVEHAVNNQEFNWQSLNIISEAIIQQRLRKNGYEIKCYELNTFPTNSKMLYSLLEKG
jgi:hypothetical protein